MILQIVEGPKGSGKSTYLRLLPKFLSEQIKRPIKVIHLDKTTPNTLEYIQSLHDEENLYILDRGWLSELVYSKVYDRDELFNIEDTFKYKELLEIPLTIINVHEAEVSLLYKRLSRRDHIELTEKDKRQIRNSNQLFDVYAYYYIMEAPSRGINIDINILKANDKEIKEKIAEKLIEIPSNF